MGQMYFGTMERMQMVNAAISELPANNQSYAEVLSYVNGGMGVVRSMASARTFDMSWVGTPDEINVFKQYQQGYYGPGPFYMVDPMSMHYNVLPPNWASPRLIREGDWKNLYTTDPTFVAVAPNNYNQPAWIGVWNITSAASGVPEQVLTIPIPPSQKLHVGASGSATGTAVIRVRPVNLDGSYASTTDLTLLAATGSTRMNASFSGATYKAVQLYFTRTSTAASTLSVTSMMGQLWDISASPALSGNHIPGDGFMGLEFASAINESYYQAAGPGKERKGASVQLVEVEPWL